MNKPERYGVAKVKKNKIISIIEKPKKFVSDLAITGLYFFDNKVVQYAKKLKPSKRGEIEITDLLNTYKKNKKLSVDFIGRGGAWLDTGSINDYYKTINFVLGDSHARNYMPAIRKAFEETSDTLYMTNGQDCLFSLSDYSYSLSDDPELCKEQTLSTLKFLNKFAKSGDFVFIGQSLYSSRLKQRVKNNYFNGIAKITNSLREKGIKVFLMDGTSPPPIPPEGCIFFPNRRGCNIEKNVVIDLYSDFDNLAKKYSNKYDFKYIPLRDGLCSGDVCSQKSKSGTYIWHDYAGHITEKSAEELAPFILDRIKNTE